MNSIFISYRREDSEWVSGLIQERLAAHFGSDSIFTDIDSIPLGVNFKKYIDEQVSECDIFLAVIGEKWLSVTDAGDHPRIQQPGDFVRLEIESALQREIPVIPLLVGNVVIPSADKLPKSLRELSFRHGIRIRPKPTFDSDVGRLISGIEKHLGIQGKIEEAAAAKPVAGTEVAKKRKVPRKKASKRKVAKRKTKLPGTVFRDTLKDGSQGPEMVVIPAGSFVMGSPEEEREHKKVEVPQHRVTFRKLFMMGKYAVTFAEYDQYCASIGRDQPDDEDWGRENRPVINVNWDDAVAYCEWLSAQTDKRYRLPSEAEWEYAARAGTTTAYWWGDTVGKNRAHCDGCGSEWDREQTAPVGSFYANAFGLHDMSGNVSEWVQDCAHWDYAGAPADGSAWEAGGVCGNRMLRGGCFYFDPGEVRSASRSMNFEVEHRNMGFGFRLAQDIV